MELKQPTITSEDVLNGSKTFPVGKRNGGTVEVTVRGLPWRTALAANSAAARGDTDTATALALTECLDKTQRKDEFLNNIVPGHLFWISLAALQLSNGVDEAKKLEATKSAPGSETSSLPSAS